MNLEEVPYNFGALPMPPGYRVSWWKCHEHYQAVGPDDWEGDISVDPYWCRRQAIWHSKQVAAAENIIEAPEESKLGVAKANRVDGLTRIGKQMFSF